MGQHCADCTGWRVGWRQALHPKHCAPPDNHAAAIALHCLRYGLVLLAVCGLLVLQWVVHAACLHSGAFLLQSALSHRASSHGCAESSAALCDCFLSFTRVAQVLSCPAALATFRLAVSVAGMNMTCQWPRSRGCGAAKWRSLPRSKLRESDWSGTAAGRCSKTDDCKCLQGVTLVLRFSWHACCQRRCFTVCLHGRMRTCNTIVVAQTMGRTQGMLIGKRLSAVLAMVLRVHRTITCPCTRHVHAASVKHAHAPQMKTTVCV